MKISENRLKELVSVVAIAFYLKAEDGEQIESPIDGIIKCISETLQSGNAMIHMTFSESMILVKNHENDIMTKVMLLVHHNNFEHECSSCVLEYLCEPSEEDRNYIETKKNDLTHHPIGSLQNLMDVLSVEEEKKSL
ncbi:hypothetical protein LCGC14_1843530 [marine sediment metagenome]|uniref:Uncharacterized protein n=1 Tax=marine sediment metagenome TaxID=412755 RepID=A0A0F9JBT2_9ZZZZ